MKDRNTSSKGSKSSQNRNSGIDWTKVPPYGEYVVTRRWYGSKKNGTFHPMKPTSWHSNVWKLCQFEKDLYNVQLRLALNDKYVYFNEEEDQKKLPF